MTAGIFQTLEVVGLVAASLAKERARGVEPLTTAGAGTSELIPSSCTLVVAPPTLVSQWLAEVSKSVQPSLGIRIAKYASRS